MTCCSAIACSSLISRRARRSRSVSDVRGASLDVTRGAPGRSPRSGDAAPARAPPAADAQSAAEDDRGADRVVLAGPSRAGPQARRVGAAAREVGGIVVSPNGVWKVLCRHGLNTRAKRLGLIAGYAAPYEPPRDPGPERHECATSRGERSRRGHRLAPVGDPVRKSSIAWPQNRPRLVTPTAPTLCVPRCPRAQAGDARDAGRTPPDASSTSSCHVHDPGDVTGQGRRVESRRRG